MHRLSSRALGALTAAAGVFLVQAPALADPLALAEPTSRYPSSIFEQVMPPQGAEQSAPSLPANLRRQMVNYDTREAAGTIVIDTPHTYLYFVLGGGKAIRYGIGVGRQGFTWSGTQTIARKAEWPDWYPPDEMIQRQPYLPRVMAGGPSNPLGARAMYLGNTEYRIHGTNAPDTIGKHVSSGCIRLLNADVIDLYGRAKVGTKVVVLPNSAHATPTAQLPRTHATTTRASMTPASTAPTAAIASNGLGGVY